MLVGGGPRTAAGGAVLTLVDPSTGLPHAAVPDAGPADVAAAVGAARAALAGDWGAAAPAARAAVLRRAAGLVARDGARLAELEARDAGRPVGRMAVQDIPLIQRLLHRFADRAEALLPETRAAAPEGLRLEVRPEPAGVAAVLLPWNVALMITAMNVAPALAAGCALVLKPADEVALPVLGLASLFAEAGLPAGALNVVTGRGAGAGAALVNHPDVDVVAFTGSTATGRRVAAAAGRRGRPCRLELGGKNVAIVLDDADLDATVPLVALAAFANSGQACTAASRILVAEPVAAAFTERLVAHVEALPVGPALDPATRLGPVVSAAHLARVRGAVTGAVRVGARVATGGGPPAGVPARGFYLAPTVLVDVPPGAACLREEVFGPVATVESVDGVEDALRRAAAGPYGLAGGVFTRDPRAAALVAGGLDVGTVWVNCWHVYDADAPFGGRRDSGHGRVNGGEALAPFLSPRTVWTPAGEPPP
ncbi:MAG TPA: aldehyde dehydrogenase family protein [Miltoncostaeaceae bacterium]|nr:aldehyde dehydrogenase family protein [Miltoncostaeaceae bacterium]